MLSVNKNRDMKKVLLLAMLVSMSLSASAMLWNGCVYSMLSVSDNGNWSADILAVQGIPDSLILVSGSDTARFVFTESDMPALLFDQNIISVVGNGQGTTLSFSWSKNTYSSKAIAMNPTLDSLEIKPNVDYLDGEIIEKFRGDIIRYGGANDFPALGDGRIIHVSTYNWLNYDSYCGWLGRSFYVKTRENIQYPYVLKGRVYDQYGNSVLNSKFSLLGSYCRNNYMTTDNYGDYLLNVEFMRVSINDVFYATTALNNIPIQPITLGKPFGDTINVDIHLLGPLAEGETAPDAITVQRTGSILHVSGAVHEIALIDASGRRLSCTRSADVDIEQLPAGIYYLSVTLEDGRMLRHPFNK